MGVPAEVEGEYAHPGVAMVPTVVLDGMTRRVKQ